MRPLDDRLLGALLDLAVNISGEGSVAGNLVIFIYLFIYLSYGDKPFFFIPLVSTVSITFSQSHSTSLNQFQSPVHVVYCKVVFILCSKTFALKLL